MDLVIEAGSRPISAHNRSSRPLHGFGVAERPDQVLVAAVEVERRRLGPQPPDDRARFGEVPDRVGGVVVGQAVCLVRTPGHRVPSGIVSASRHTRRMSP
jgi:hypothetical protein